MPRSLPAWKIPVDRGTVRGEWVECRTEGGIESQEYCHWNDLIFPMFSISSFCVPVASNHLKTRNQALFYWRPDFVKWSNILFHFRITGIILRLPSEF